MRCNVLVKVPVYCLRYRNNKLVLVSSFSFLLNICVFISLTFLIIFVQIITKPGRVITLNVICKEEVSVPSHSQSSATLSVQAEEPISNKTSMELILRCSDLEHKDLFSKSVWFCLALTFFHLPIFTCMF